MYWLSYFKQREAFSNCEGVEAYDFSLLRSRAVPGVSAMVRVRNEAQKISHCLRSILPVFDEIIVVDNASDDGTIDIVRDVIGREDTAGKIRLLSYPYRLARFGPEHAATPDDSLHSAVYYTNWTLSHCTRRYVCKWDGDMVLVRKTRTAFREFLHGLQAGRPACWTLSGQTVYRDDHGDYYLARGEINKEIEIFPYSLMCRFKKRPHLESLQRPVIFPKKDFTPVCFFELKFVDEDEFSHWSDREWPSERKRREWANYQLVRDGQVHTERFERLGRAFLDTQVL
jgi:glycosyltransferase involved in cell wall biosynthesis